MDSLATNSLLDAPLIPEKAIRHVNFFNGRLLTASDMRAQQLAERQGRRQLGRAIGAGVVAGFEAALVSDGTDGRSPIVEITGGLAITPSGQVIELSLSKVNVTLARREPLLPIDAGLFDDCVRPPAPSDITGSGTYVLAVTVASEYRELAPMVPVGGNGIATGCGDAYAVEGAAFRLVEMPDAALAGVSATTRDEIELLRAEADQQSLTAAERRARLSRLRNLMAHACFGTEELAGFLSDPWRRVGGLSPHLAYGAVDRLRQSGDLGEWDVPLALVYWTNRGVRFLDMWSVRRRPVPPERSSTWPTPAGERFRIEAEARFLQFQHQIEEAFTSTLSQTSLAATGLREHVRYLPPVSLVPLAGVGSLRGFDLLTLLAGLTFRPQVFLNGARLAPLIAQSLDYSPVDVESGEMLWTYVLRENVQAIDAGQTPRPQLTLVLSSGHLPYAGDPQYDLSYWNYAHYGLGVGHTHQAGG